MACDGDCPTGANEDNHIVATDISSYPEIAQAGTVFYNSNNQQDDLLNILKQNGVNTIRLRLWVNPTTPSSGYTEVASFAHRLRQKGFKLWISAHYSDTWADPSHQEIPLRWRGLAYNELKDSVRMYSQKVARELQPDFIQVGNEINSGFLHPVGSIEHNPRQFVELMSVAIRAVRECSPRSKIIVHYAGLAGSAMFYERMEAIDYDIIGLSYYPIWHGKNLDQLKVQMEHLCRSFKKPIVIAETAYPFTLAWNDHTGNVVGLDEQLILPAYPATPQGQRSFVNRVKTIVREIDGGLGFCYWGGELVAWRGQQATNGSVWENQALFDFQNRALPVLEEFNY